MDIVVSDLPCIRVESIQAITCREPQLAGAVLANMDDGNKNTARSVAPDAVVRKRLGSRVKPVEELVASYPKLASAIFE
jgi:hypothetical protein